MGDELGGLDWENWKGEGVGAGLGDWMGGTGRAGGVGAELGGWTGHTGSTGSVGAELGVWGLDWGTGWGELGGLRVRTVN